MKVYLKVFLVGTTTMLTLACTDELDCSQAALCSANLSHPAVDCAATDDNLVLGCVDILNSIIFGLLKCNQTCRLAKES